MPQHVSGFPQTVLTHCDAFQGRIGIIPQATFGELSLPNAIQQAITVSSYMLFTVGQPTLALYIQPNLHDFFIFDSHQRNHFCVFDPNGAAVLLDFTSLYQLILEDIPLPDIIYHRLNILWTTTVTYIIKIPFPDHIVRSHHLTSSPATSFILHCISLDQHHSLHHFQQHNLSLLQH